MTANQAVFPIATMSAALGASRSGFYARRSRPPSARALADAVLTEKIAAFHARSGGTYGAPRIHADLTEAGIHVGRKRVERLMRAAGLVGVSRRRFARTTIRDERVRPAAIWSTATSRQRSPTGSGSPTSPTSRPGRAFSTWPWCWTLSRARSWAGRWRATSGRSSSSTP
jgi:transposase InsO family protein